MYAKATLTTILILTLLFGAAGIASASPDSFSITVQGIGDIGVSPTKLQMWIGAQTDGETAEETLALSNDTIQKLIEVFKQFAPPELIKTANFDMYQREQWDDVNKKSIPIGFTIRQVFEVQILELNEIATFLDQATAAGANIIYGLQYGIQDYRTPKEEAFKRAMEDAWWKAQLLATTNKAEHLVLESVEETYYYGGEYGGESNSLGMGQTDSFMPGQLKISVSVTATFQAQTQ